MARKDAAIVSLVTEADRTKFKEIADRREVSISWLARHVIRQFVETETITATVAK